jgi:CRP/FNR family transcriptional regulator, cyclic AMP receptor protein
MVMKANHTAASRNDIQNLAQAIRHGTALDTLPLTLSDSQWSIFVNYLQPIELPHGELLFEQGHKNRSVYFVESGTLSVHLEDSRSRIRIAVVGGGSVLGEGAFFSHLPRNATVQAGADCKLWCMTALRFRELALRHPEVALAVSMAMAAVLARRLQNKPKRVAVT